MKLPTRDFALDPDGYAYVLEFSNGIIKVGQTMAPRLRCRQHEIKAQAVGVTLAQTWVSPLHRQYDKTEKALISAATSMGQLAQGAEYFVGCDFDALVQEASSWEFTESSPEIRARVAAERQSKKPTAAWLLADQSLGGDLDRFVLSRRAKGVTWRRISLELFHESDASVDAPPTTLINWYRNKEFAA